MGLESATTQLPSGDRDRERPLCDGRLETTGKVNKGHGVNLELMRGRATGQTIGAFVLADRPGAAAVRASDRRCSPAF